MGDEQRGARVLGEVAVQLGPGVQPGPGVQRGERLVEQQQRRVDRERPGQRDPLGLPAGELAGLAPGVARPGRPGPASAAAWSRASAPVARRGGAGRTRRCPARSGAGRAGSPGTPRRSGAAPAVRSAARSGRRAASPSRVMCPAVSGSSPASARSAVVLPAPLGPSSATTSPGGDRQSAGRGGTCPGRRRGARPDAVPSVGSWRGRASGRAGRPGSATETASRIRLSTIASSQVGLQGQIDGQRHGLGTAREVAGEGDGGAELAERAGPAQHRAGGDARARPAAG